MNASDNSGNSGSAGAAAPVTSNFIRHIIEQDLQSGKHAGRVQTRFPPEPNGFLHIGHAKSICLNFGTAQANDGRCNLRFDDTNPEKESQEFINSIKADIQWLGFSWSGEIRYASSYFDALFEFALQLISAGKAYVCSLTPEQAREYRGNLTSPGRESPYRNRSIEENLDLFIRMRAGDFPDGAHSLRARIDMASPNINMRGVYGKSKLITFDQADWRAKREMAGGGVLLDQGIHMVDLMRLFAGEFTDVHSFVSNSHWNYDVEDNAYAIMRTSNGVVAMLNSSATQWRHQFSLDINMQKGSIILRGILSGSKSYGSETMTTVFANPDRDNGDPKELTQEYSFDPSWTAEIDAFADVVRNNLTIESGTSHDALMTMQLVHKIYYADPKWRDTYSIPNPDFTN